MKTAAKALAKDRKKAASQRNAANAPIFKRKKNGGILENSEWLSVICYRLLLNGTKPTDCR